jgi:hypothetical protein
MSKHQILLISPVPSHPQTAGNRARIYNLALSIKNLGHDLHFAHVARERGDSAAMAECWGCDTFHSIPYKKPNNLLPRIKRRVKSLLNKDARYTSNIDDWYDDHINSQLKNLYQQHEYDIVLVEYVFFSKALTCFPGQVLKVVDTHDVMTNRHKLYLQNNQKYNWFSTTAAQERKGLRRADITIAIQERERLFFNNLTKRKTITIGHTVKTQQVSFKRNGSKNMLFIGSANQSNIDAVSYFVDSIFPEIKKQVPEAALLIAGPVCRKINTCSDGILKIGEPSNLDDAYDQADIVINPIRFGTGLKVKNIEALGYSKALVTTSTGAEGMEKGIQSAFLVADDPMTFSNAVVRIVQDQTLFQSLSRNGFNFAVEWNQMQMSSLQEILNADFSRKKG